ncbi:GNAT family N-acetyltransferase [Pelagicoccus mobilis]|uniref:GNAT family N-acetyltransferase n=1 Tax=Pelagicoccus mobilis TaxID=415221 RepID=A0A934RRV6_9BACT|nr:GNAT family N-acetyltransferase [Pelagicoccus mobilis]MBK1876430.1 GNAT family N-acetyltransferase [Pelagicoccus mobilis]
MNLAVRQRVELDDEEIRELLNLWQRVWPLAEFDEESDLDRVREFRETRLGTTDREELFHVLCNGGRIVGVARSFLREIEFIESGERIRVLALAGVCSEPEARGVGVGKAVVESAFARIGEDVPCSLFQTGVPGFYEKLGAFLVENEFVNSKSADDSSARPWWDPYVMVLGERGKWPEGRVDLLGAAY